MGPIFVQLSHFFGLDSSNKIMNVDFSQSLESGEN